MKHAEGPVLTVSPVNEVIRLEDGRAWHCVENKLAILFAGPNIVAEVNNTKAGWSIWVRGIRQVLRESFKTRSEAMREAEIRSNQRVSNEAR